MLIWNKIGLFIVSCSFMASAYDLKAETFSQSNQEILPTGFSRFENLYFHQAEQAFFTLGQNIQMDKAVYPGEKRGCSWLNYQSLPTALINKDYHQAVGTTLILLERKATPYHYRHYFHFLEHLIGLWSFGGERARDQVNKFLFIGNGTEFPEDWKGYNDVTAHLIAALFPKAEIQFWNDFNEETKDQVVCLENVIISDRCMEYVKKEPYYTDRMLGGYFESLTKESLDHMTACVYEYTGVKREETSKVSVTYVKRQPPRCLSPVVEKELIDKITRVPNVELKIVDYAELSFSEQINATANTDVLLGVHGNGLSHALFLPNGATLIELFPKNSFRVEYRIFALSRHLKYFGFVPGIGWINKKMAEKKGCFGDVYKPVDGLDVDAVLSVIKKCKKAQSNL